MPEAASTSVTVRGWREEFRARWRVLAACTVGVATGLPLYSYVQSIFIKQFQAEFGWSRGQIALGMNALLVGALTVPLFGVALDRFGTRRVAFAGIACLAIGYCLLANVQANIWTLYTALAFTIILAPATGPLGYTRAIAGAFESSRGIALAIVLAGISVSAMIMPPVITHLVDSHGWRAGYYALAAIAVCVGLPIVMAWLREPEFGAGGDAKRKLTRAAGLPGLSAGAAVRTRAFWVLTVAIALVTVPAIGLATQLQPLLTDKGFSNADAALLVSAFAAAVLAGRLLVGALLDRYWAPGVACASLLLSSLGALALIGNSPQWPMALAGVALLGFAQGAELDLLPFMVARYFGMRAYGRVYGLITMGFALATAGGSILFGTAYDRDGSYDSALRIASMCLVASALTFLAMGSYPRLTVPSDTG